MASQRMPWLRKLPAVPKKLDWWLRKIINDGVPFVEKMVHRELVFPPRRKTFGWQVPTVVDNQPIYIAAHINVNPDKGIY